MEYLSLSQLNLLVSDSLKLSFPETYWIMAETSDVRVNQSSGHCYLEFVEKNEKTGNLIAKARAYIWSSTFRVFKPYFEHATGQSFVSGLKVLVRVGIDFHELYGYGLTVYDIEPSYTMGDLQRKRREIILQLEEEGVLTLNKELSLSPLPQRIAVITSPTAAGYEDFLEHLLNNRYGFVFYPKLFPAIMQGEQTESSVILALEKIYEHKDLFDVVVIIRGGGATSDLTSFDSYLLAANCAQFPLPVITGIGHERDDTVLDIVAYKRAKTPTAVADFMIEKIEEAYDGQNILRERFVALSGQLLEEASMKLQNLLFRLPVQAIGLIEKQISVLELYEMRLKNAAMRLLQKAESQLVEKESFLKLSSPEYILSKGYSITRLNGKTIKNSEILKKGDQITTRFYQGEIRSTVE